MLLEFSIRETSIPLSLGIPFDPYRLLCSWTLIRFTIYIQLESHNKLQNYIYISELPLFIKIKRIRERLISIFIM